MCDEVKKEIPEFKADIEVLSDRVAVETKADDAFVKLCRSVQQDERAAIRNRMVSCAIPMLPYSCRMPIFRSSSMAQGNSTWRISRMNTFVWIKHTKPSVSCGTGRKISDRLMGDRLWQPFAGCHSTNSEGEDYGKQQFWLETPQHSRHYSIYYLGRLAYLDRMVMAIIPYISDEFGLTPVAMGGVMSAFFVGYALCQIPGGFLADRFGAQKVMFSGIAWWSVFTSLRAWPTIWCTCCSSASPLV